LSEGCSSPARVLEPVTRRELRFCVHAEPKDFNPLMASEEPEEIVRFLTSGVLIRMNRLTQAFEPELAESWRILDGGRKVEFKLREGVRFSDGVPLTTGDVVFTMRTLLDPAMHSPAADPFRTGRGAVSVTEPGGRRVVVTFPATLAGVER